MNKKLLPFVLGAAAIGLGISMPSCPGQQAMQQQLDQIKNEQANLARRMDTLEKTGGGVTSEINTQKARLEGIEKTLGEQKQMLTDLDAKQKAAEQLRSAPPAKNMPFKKRK